MTSFERKLFLSNQKVGIYSDESIGFKKLIDRQ